MRLLLIIVWLIAGYFPVSGQYRLDTGRMPDTSRATDSAAVKSVPVPAKQPLPAPYRRMYNEPSELMLKINPMQLVRGALPVYLEYRISNHFSVEVAAGITYLDPFYETAVNDGYFLFNKRAKFRNGFLGAAQFRYFPSRREQAPAGFYTGPQLAARNYQMHWLTNTGFIVEKELEKRNMYDLRWVAGWQNPNTRDQWFFDMYGALGVRYIRETRVAEIPGVVLPKPERVVPSAEIGFKLGYCL